MMKMVMWYWGPDQLHFLEYENTVIKSKRIDPGLMLNTLLLLNSLKIIEHLSPSIIKTVNIQPINVRFKLRETPSHKRLQLP